MKRDLPETGDLVIASVREVRGFGAKVVLVEYENVRGFIHIAEVARGWVKNIRNYLKEGQNVVCKVLSTDASRRYVELSLKRVNQHQKREKISEWKNEQKANKLLEIVAARLNTTVENCRREFADALVDSYETLYGAFEDAVESENWLPDVNDPWKEVFVQVARENISPAEVTIGGELELYSLESDGVLRVKSCVEDVSDRNVRVTYQGAPVYRISVVDKDFKSAEEILKLKVDMIIGRAKEVGVHAEFKRT